MRNEKPTPRKRIDLPDADLMQRMLNLANALHTTPPAERLSAALNGMADLVAADAIAAWNGPAERLVSVGIAARIGETPSIAAMLPPGVKTWLSSTPTLSPTVTQHSHLAQRTHDIRSLCTDDAGPSLLVLRRTGSPFTQRDRVIVTLMHPQIEWCLRPPLTPHELASQLPAPQQVVFELLLTGSTEKRLAARLKKSEQAIASHVKKICRHFDVASRSQLVEKFASAKPGK